MAATAAQRSRLDKLRLFKDLGYEPHPGQMLVHLSQAPRRVVACGVRWGKSTLAAMEIIAAAMEPRQRFTIWACAPTYELSEKIYREVVIKVAEHLPHRIVTLRENDKRLVVRNMAGGLAEVRSKSTDNPLSLLGEGLDFLALDEASRLRPNIWQAHLSQRLVDKRGTALLISTPKGQGYFYDLYRRGQGEDPDYESWNMPSWTNPLLDASMIEQERERLPARVFDQEYGAIFTSGEGAVFAYVRDLAIGELQEPHAGERYVAGLDLARVSDFTVLTIMDRERRVVYCDRFIRLDWAVQVNRVKAACDRYGRARLLLDATGIGDPIFESFRRAGCRVDAYTLTQRSKAALIDNLSLMLEQRMIELPRPELCPELISELESYSYSVTDSGNVHTSAPGGQHDDAVISLALAAWQVRPSRPKPGIVVLEGTPWGD